jgi:hypothetical protein
VLRAVMNGEIHSAEEFRNKLAGKPLSSYWTAAKPVEPPKKKSAWPVILLLLLLGGGGGLAAWAWQQGLFGNGKAGNPTQLAMNSTNSASRPSSMATKPNTSAKSPLPKVETDWKNKPKARPPEGSDFDKLLKQFDATADPKVWRDLLGKMYDLYDKSSESERKGILPWVEHCRGRYVGDWARRYKVTDAEVVKDPSQRYEVAQKIHELNQELDGLHLKHEPISPSLNERDSECLTISALRSSELGLRRSPLP